MEEDKREEGPDDELTTNMDYKDEQEEEENFLEPIKDWFYTEHYRGRLPLILLTITITINLLFYEYPVGYTIYLIIPIIGYLLILFSQYWNSLTMIRFMLALMGIILCAGLDLFVSISYIPNYDTGGYDLNTIPTAILDSGSLISFMMWVKKNHKQLS